MIKGTILILCLLLSNLAFSQNGQAKRILYNGDSVNVIPDLFIRSANHAHIAAVAYKNISDSLLSIIDSCQSTFTLYDSSISSLKDEVSLDLQSVQERDIVIARFEYITTQYKKKITKLRTQRTLLVITNSIIIGITIALYIL